MSIPILTYHRLLEKAPDRRLDPKRIAVSQKQFHAHMALLSRLGYTSVSLPDYVRLLKAGRQPQGRCFAITFDDGYEEVLTLALPVLQTFHFTATVFAVSGQLGGCNAWDDGGARLLSIQQYQILQNAGIAIGAHTRSHAHLPQVETALARREISDSKTSLEEALRRPVSIFAYPYGESTPAVEALVKEAGFEAAFATDRAPRDHRDNLFRIRRVVIFPRTNTWELFWKLQSWYPALQDWKRR